MLQKTKTLKLVGKVGNRSKNLIIFHKRRGHPIIHENKRGKRYIMVRKKGGGVKRLYEGSKYLEGK